MTNGAGKTTLVDAVTGLVKASGSVRFGGEELLGRPVHRIARLGIGRTFQTATVFEELTVLQNLDIAAGAGRGPLTMLRRRKGVPEEVTRALETTGLTALRDRPAGVLAHGQKQWLEIGMLLVKDVRLLLLDEPVAGMSHDEPEATGRLLRRISEDRTVVVIEHDMDFMRSFARSVSVLHAGKVLSEGSVTEVQADARVQEVYLGRASEPEPETRAGRRPRRRGGVRPMLQIQSVRAGYDRTTVLHGVTVEVPKDGVAAVLGHNGAGKSTLLRTVMGLLPASAGTVLLDGEDITRLAPHKRVARGVAYVPQGQQSFPHLTTAENLRLVADGRPDGQEAVAEALDLFPVLRELSGRRAGLLSGGQRQQLAIARALVTRPRLLLLDEPTEGIQPSVVAEIEETILALTRRGGLSVLLVEQHVGFAMRAAQRYYVLEAGRVTSSGDGGAEAEGTVRAALSV